MEDKHYFKNFEENQKKEIKLLQDIYGELKEANKYNIPLIQSIGKMQLQLQMLYNSMKELVAGLNIINLVDKKSQGGK